MTYRVVNGYRILMVKKSKKFLDWPWRWAKYDPP